MEEMDIPSGSDGNRFAGDKNTMEIQKHIEVTCPGLIQSYNANMGEGV